MPRSLFAAALTLAVGLTSSFASPVRADDEAPSLLRLLGEDVGLLVHVTDGEATVRAAFAGELADRIRDTSLYQQWLDGRDHANLVRALAAVRRVLGEPAESFAANLVGRECVLALLPRAGGEPEAVILTRAASEESLAKALETWDRLQRPTESREITYGSHRFRMRRHAEETGYIATIGPVLVVAQSEAALRAVLDRSDAASDTGSVLATQRYTRALADVPSDAAATAYFNPRAWDDSLPEPRDEPGRVVREVFDRVESVVATLRTGDGVVLDVSVRYDESAADARWQRYVDRIAGDGRFLERVPSRALYVAVGRVDLAEIGNAIYGSLSEEDRKRVDPWRRFVSRRVLDGLDPLDGLLAAIGPEWGAYVVPREELISGVSPVEGLIAVELPSVGEGDTDIDAEAVRRALDDLLTDGLELWVAVHNSTTGEDRAAVHSRDDDGVRTRWIEGIGPYRPSFAVAPRFLVLSSTPTLVPEFASPEEGQRLVDTPEFTRTRDRYFPEAKQLVFLHVGEVRRFVAEHRAFLLAELSGRPDGTPPRAVRLEELLGLVDTAFLAGSINESHVRLVIGIVAERAE